MANYPYLSGLTIVTPLDPAYADIWGDYINAILLESNQAAGRQEIHWTQDSVIDGTYTLKLNSRHAGTIKQITSICQSGTATATFKINNVALGGTANSVSSSEQTQTHASSNTFVAGDDLKVTFSSASSCLRPSFNIWYDQTSAGTA